MTMMTCSFPLSIFIKKTKKIMKINFNSSSTNFFLNPKNDENNGCNWEAMAWLKGISIVGKYMNVG